MFGFQNRYSDIIAARQDLASVKGMQRRFAKDVGYPVKRPISERPEKKPISVWRDPLNDALTIGDVDGARQIIKDARKGMSAARWKLEAEDLKKHIRAKQPIQALGGSAAGRSEFNRWAKDNLSDYERETVRRLETTYRRTAMRLGLDLELKPAELEDVLKLRQRIKLKQESTGVLALRMIAYLYNKDSAFISAIRTDSLLCFSYWSK